ncbi:hypothetical protein Dimus_000981 [Dionaea muscipula]
MSSVGEVDLTCATSTRTEDEMLEIESDTMSEPVSSISDDEEEREVTCSKSEGGIPTSIVWDHFDRVTRKGEVKPVRAKCKHCMSSYKWLSGNGTSTRESM